MFVGSHLNGGTTEVLVRFLYVFFFTVFSDTYKYVVRVVDFKPPINALCVCVNVYEFKIVVECWTTKKKIPWKLRMNSSTLYFTPIQHAFEKIASICLFNMNLFSLYGFEWKLFHFGTERANHIEVLNALVNVC